MAEYFIFLSACIGLSVIGLWWVPPAMWLELTQRDLQRRDAI
jgi:hypothetical protein